MTFQNKRRGTVTLNGRDLYVTDIFGKETIFRRGSIHYPGALPTGTTGMIEYIPMPDMALDWFTPDKPKETK